MGTNKSGFQEVLADSWKKIAVNVPTTLGPVYPPPNKLSKKNCTTYCIGNLTIAMVLVLFILFYV